MEPLTIGLLLIAAMVVLIAAGMQIGIVLFALGAAGVWLIRDNFNLAVNMTAISTFSGIQDYLFATIPLFVLMGLLVSISDVGKDTFDVAQNLLRRVRGGLGMATVAANAVFAAVTGVSIASAAVFTKVAVPEMMRHGYTLRFATGAVAGSSILGMLIPPSLLMIIYGVLAEVSIGKMFVAGVIPGAIVAIGFVAMIYAAARWRPHMVMAYPERDAAERAHDHVMGVAEMAQKAVPILALVALVLVGLYAGFFTPTEAGGVGAFGALLIALARRRLDLLRFWRILTETGHVSVSILFLLIAASFYAKMLSLAGVPQAIGDAVSTLGFGAVGFLIVYILILLLLGMLLDSSSIMLIMVPIAAPIAQNFGFDLIQFGIITIIAVEAGLLTPPFGISVFTVKATLEDRSARIEDIFAGSMPFVAVMLVALALICLFPILSTALVR